MTWTFAFIWDWICVNFMSFVLIFLINFNLILRCYKKLHPGNFSFRFSQDYDVFASDFQESMKEMFLKMSIYLLGLFDGIQHRAQDMQLVPVEAPVAGPWNQIQDGGGAQQNQPGVQNNEEAHTHIYIYNC